MRERVGRALDRLPFEYVVDEVVRRMAGTGEGSLTLHYRDGFVVRRRVVHVKPSEADLAKMLVRYDAWQLARREGRAFIDH